MLSKTFYKCQDVMIYNQRKSLLLKEKKFGEENSK